MNDNKDRHVTASEIIAYLSCGENSVGSATIYRYLDKLVSGNIIRKFYLDEKTGACYQMAEDNAECHEHFHLKCINCGKLYHIDCSYMKSLNSHIFEHHGFKVDNSKTVLIRADMDALPVKEDTDNLIQPKACVPRNLEYAMPAVMMHIWL